MADKGSPGSTTDPWKNFNSEFLGYTIVTGVLAVFFLLYFNRVVASIVSAVIRTYTWHRYRIYIDVQALQLSLLGGRLFFTGLRYHGDNETILIQNGHITWSYWLRRVRDAQVYPPNQPSAASDNADSDSSSGRQKLPCRINIAVSGLEWFVYNRSAAYDSILQAMTDATDQSLPFDNVSGNADGGSDDHYAGFTRDDEKLAGDPMKPRQRLRRPTTESARLAREGVAKGSLDDEKNQSESLHTSSHPRAPSVSSSASDDAQNDSNALPFILQLYPIHFECDTAAMVMGNENTKALLIMKTKSLSGEIDAAKCQTVDPYRQLFEIDFDHPVLEMVEHSGYKEDQLARAAREKQSALDTDGTHRRSFFRIHRRKVLGHLRNVLPYWRSSVESFSIDSRAGIAPTEPPIPGLNHWQGLSRYLNADDEDENTRWSSLDYAAVTTIVDTPGGALKIYWDVPSKVSSAAKSQSSSLDPNSPDFVNGTAPPAWAISLALKGGVVNYGPWADRQRAELQRVFFPGLCKDAAPAKALPIGSDRVPTTFNFYLELNDEATLRIPTRESSKNWKWKREGHVVQQQQRENDQRGGQNRGRNRKKAPTTTVDQRPFGWLDIKIGTNATVSYKMDMLPRPAGYRNSLKIDLPSTEVSTSVNHGLMWKSGAQHISCDLSTPLKWNGLRTWKFNIDSDGMELFLLREHTFLLIDLVDDWGSGPPSEYMLFTPFKYLLHVSLRNLKLNINVNDVNIINDPTSMDENTYLVLSSPCLTIDTRINLDNFRPSKNVVPFKIESDFLQLQLHAPPWNTQATFLTSKDIGSLEKLLIEANYHYHTTTSPAKTDTLVLDVSAQSPVVYLYGFLIRYFLLLKDNYFGDYVHFKTLDEYQHTLRVEAEGSKAGTVDHPPPKKSNDLDVMLSIRTDDPRIILPANLYSAKRHIPLEAASLGVDLRFTNYYMDLDLWFTPISLSMGDEDGGAASPTSFASKTQLFVDGLTVYGHRLFGLPPTEPTYLCNWDINIGPITGDCSAEFLSTLVQGGKAFGFSLDDDENALISPAAVYDVTFLRVNVESIHVWLHIEDFAFLCSSGLVQVHFNDWARTHYSKRADISVPRLEFSCVQTESVARHSSGPKSQTEANILFRTNVNFAFIGRNYEFANVRQLQQELLRRHDQRTHRTDFLLLPDLPNQLQPDSVDPVAQSVPTVPQPVSSTVIKDKISVSSTESSLESRPLRHKSSFLSLASASEGGSVRRGSTRMRKGSGSPERSFDYTRSFRSLEPDCTPATNQRSSSERNLLSDSFFGTSRINPIHRHLDFTSQFIAPNYPSRSAQQNLASDMAQSAENDTGQTGLPTPEFRLEDLDPEQFPQDRSHQSLLLDFPSGIALFLDATSLQCIVGLLGALQPANPEDLLDNLHIGAMSDLFATQKKGSIGGAVTDFSLRLPLANLQFLNNTCAEDSSPPCQDQFDMTVTNMTFAIRLEDHGNETENGTEFKDTLPSFHFQLAAITFSVSENPAASDMTQSTALLEVERAVAIMSSKEINYLDADIGAIRMKSSFDKVEFVASMARRTISLISTVEARFSALSSVGVERLKYLTYSLVMDGQRIGDPYFVVRPSAVLRAARRHLRTYDSWKMVARLRYMWASLTLDSRTNIMQHCLDGQGKVPKDVREQVVTAFDQWRSWDLEDSSHAVLLDILFGRRADKSSNPQLASWMAVGRVHQLGLSLDPYATNNHILIQDLTARASNQHRPGETSQNQDTLEHGPLTIVNLYCRQADMSLGWEAIDLADHLLPLFLAADSPPDVDIQVSDHGALADKKSAPPVHFILLIDQSKISLNTIHLAIEPRCENLKFSVVNGNPNPGAMATNVALSCDTAALNILSDTQELAATQLTKPSVIIAYESLSTEQSNSHAVRAAASSQGLGISILQDPIVLAEVADSLIVDEATQLRALQKKMSTHSPKPIVRKTTDDLPLSLSLNLAMFLDAYSITLPLFHSLTYKITGTVSRATLALDANHNLTLDFDVKENSHDIQVGLVNVSRSISLLQIPPMNGRVESNATSHERSITVFASLELVELDASAVYSFLTSLNRPEISNAMNELQQQGKSIQSHLQDLSDPPIDPSPAAKPENPILVYNVHATLAGVKVTGSAPIKSSVEQYARLSFLLDRIHLEIANRVDQSTILDNPEVHVNVRKIEFDIMKGSNEGIYSCGNLAFGALVTASTRESESGKVMRAFDFMSDDFKVKLSPDTVSTFVDVLGHLRDKFKKLDTSRELEYLRKLRQSKPRIAINDDVPETESDIFDSFLASVMYTFQVRNIQIGWLVTISPSQLLAGQEDLYVSVEMIEFATRKQNTARLSIEDLRLQMVPPNGDTSQRSLNSALLPEMVFNVAFISSSNARRLAFQAVGKSLDLRLTSGFIVPAAHLKDSITLSIANVQRVSQQWAPMVNQHQDVDKPAKETVENRRSLFGRKRVESILLDADFAGAVVHLFEQSAEKKDVGAAGSRASRLALAGKYGQFNSNEAGSSNSLRTPGLALKAEYRDDGKEVATLHGEIRVEPSRNELNPTVVPLILGITSSIKDVVGDSSPEPPAPKTSPTKPKLTEEESILTADPSAVLGRVKLNLGLRICKQQFTLSCQPIGRVAATASFDDIYVTVSTVHSADHGNFFALSGTFSKIHLAVQHVYSRESTGSFDVDSIVLSLMNSKHVSGTSGLSAIIKMSPMKVAINARQVHDFLLFREIWLPRGWKQDSTAPVPEAEKEAAAQGHLVQRYQQVAATAAFPWTATISISALDVAVDLGQSLGKPEFAVKEFWVSSKKTSDWEQNLCLGFQEIAINCDGRLSGFVTLHAFKLRTSIEWPERKQALNETPKIQASVGFSEFKLKAAFDYQAFLVADITTIDFLMYNVRQHKGASGDRLVAIFDGEAVQVFGTTASAAQGAALWKAIQKFIQERKANYEASLREIEKFMKRGTAASHVTTEAVTPAKTNVDEKAAKLVISLDTDVVVTLRALNLGIFPNSFSDHQVFKLEALNARARFFAGMAGQHIHSILGLTLGQLRIGLAGIRGPEAPRAVRDMQVEHVVQSATGSRGGTILKVPKVEAVMETWQEGKSRNIKYKFKSAFEGKVEVGWNYSRISYIRGMLAKHNRLLAQVWGREITAMSAIKVTGVPEPEVEQQEKKDGEQQTQQAQQQQKITAEVNVPLSKYEYEALEPPIIDTPQLRDMGEATPPLEWIGLHRDRLPNLTHQIVIVALLELAGEVEDAYAKILGS